MSRKNGQLRIIKTMAAVCAAIAVFVTLLFSVYFISQEIHHDCEGEDCPICICLQQCANTLTQMSCAAQPVVLAVSAGFVVLIILLFAEIILSRTPVTSKVRMNN